jgi:hypothetical protein
VNGLTVNPNVAVLGFTKKPFTPTYRAIPLSLRGEGWEEAERALESRSLPPAPSYKGRGSLMASPLFQGM